ncbi:MAG: hypothetical protein F6K09_29460, partial [Merismopedia sp. SIO2A8]|nr:hypothetical protein [Merismopedia sp. SIO2A8]
MTAQVFNTLDYENKTFVLINTSHGEPFIPSDYGYSPWIASTACYWGYVTEYTIQQGRLLLKGLYLNEKPHPLPVMERYQPTEPFPLNGAKASDRSAEIDNLSGCRWYFQDVDLALEYSGGLVIAHQFIWEPKRPEKLHSVDKDNAENVIWETATQMALHPACKCKEVFELVFEAGQLAHGHNLSNQMTHIRQRIQQQIIKGNMPNHREINDWVKRC